MRAMTPLESELSVISWYIVWINFEVYLKQDASLTSNCITCEDFLDLGIKYEDGKLDPQIIRDYLKYIKHNDFQLTSSSYFYCLPSTYV